MKKNYLFSLIFTATCFITANLAAQVTVGSGHKPNTGALLDLKEYEDQQSLNGGRSALRGLGLPRVKLSRIKPETPSELAASIGNSGNWDLEEHIGLTVYSAADQCASTPIEEGVHVFDGEKWQLLGKKITYKTESAANSNRSDWKSAWEDLTIIHGEKKDAEGNIIYKEFISSDFGEAGRWMTTNLAAFLYDTDLPQRQYHSADRELSPGTNPNEFDERDKAFWAYPKNNADVIVGEAPSAEFKENHHIGLLYTWDAVTAGKGGDDGDGNVDYTGVVNIPEHPEAKTNCENGLPEWDGTGIQPDKTQKRRQGICPRGWHVPSDYEWTELEREIIRNTSKYSAMDDIDNGDGTELAKVTQPANPGGYDDNMVTLPGVADPENHRGTTHGKAMKSVCPLPDSRYEPNGESNISHKGGFNALLTGRIFSTGIRTSGYGSLAIYWTSSGFPGDTSESGLKTGSAAIARNFTSARETVYRQKYLRSHMQLVRCKKDD